MDICKKKRNWLEHKLRRGRLHIRSEGSILEEVERAGMTWSSSLLTLFQQESRSVVYCNSQIEQQTFKFVMIRKKKIGETVWRLFYGVSYNELGLSMMIWWICGMKAWGSPNIIPWSVLHRQVVVSLALEHFVFLLTFRGGCCLEVARCQDFSIGLPKFQ